MKKFDRFQEIADLYNNFSEVLYEWSPSVQFKKIFDETVLEIVEKKCKLSHEVRILEVGCGHGTWINYLLKRVTNPTNIKIKGIDISEKRISLARKMLANHSNVSLKVINFMEIISSEKYDIIFFAEVLQYINEHDHYSVFNKCFKLLTNEGYLIIIDKEKYSLHALKIRILQTLGKIGFISEKYKYVSYPSFKYLSKLSEKIKLQIEKKLKIKNFHSLVMIKI